MKWTPRKNSLFAILLRSPWWYSFALALLVTLAAIALFPSNLKAAGALGSLPFVVIGVLALRRQLKQPSTAMVERTVQGLQALDWTRLAPLLQQTLRQQGYVVETSRRAEADFELLKDGRKALLLARRFKSTQTGIEPLSALRQTADELGLQDAIFVAMGELSDKAQNFATNKQVHIWRAPELAALKLIQP